MQAQSEGDPLERKRREINRRMLKRGYPDVALVLTAEGLAELEKRLNEAEQVDNTLLLDVSSLAVKGHYRIRQQVPVRYDDLPKDQKLVLTRNIEELEKKTEGLEGEISRAKGQEDVLSRRSDGEDNLARLQAGLARLTLQKARLEKELAEKREGLARLEGSHDR